MPFTNTFHEVELWTDQSRSEQETLLNKDAEGSYLKDLLSEALFDDAYQCLREVAISRPS